MLEILRTQTEYLHKEAEESGDAKKLLDFGMNIPHYKDLIRNYYIIYADVYHYIQTVQKQNNLLSEDIRSLIDTEKVKLLEKDMRVLNMVPSLPKLPSTYKGLYFSDATVLGILYTIEGSMLGRKVIAKHISESDTLKEVSAFYFFSPEIIKPSKPSKIFSNIVEILKHGEFSKQQQQEVLEGSKATFSLFINKEARSS